jgi:hypothetical protein
MELWLSRKKSGFRWTHRPKQYLILFLQAEYNELCKWIELIHPGSTWIYVNGYYCSTDWFSLSAVLCLISEPFQGKLKLHQTVLTPIEWFCLFQNGTEFSEHWRECCQNSRKIVLNVLVWHQKDWNFIRFVLTLRNYAVSAAEVISSFRSGG